MTFRTSFSLVGRRLLCHQSVQRNTAKVFKGSVAMATKTMPKVFVTARDIPENGMTLLQKVCDVTQWNSDDAIPRDELLRRVKGMDGIFCILTDKIDEEVIDAAGSQLKAVGTMSVGYEHIDLKACKSHGIPVGFTPDVLTNATAELTVGLLLATSRRLMEATQAVTNGSWGPWKPLWMCGQGLDGSTVGIVGFGRIGFAVAKCLLPFGVSRVLYCGRTEKDYAREISAEFVSFNELLTQSDFVIGCCALNPETAGIMNKSAFQKMKKTAVFVNTSRGGLVNQDDLYEALTTGQILAAGLDVTTPEPLPTNHPLLKLDNCVVLPHIGSATLKARNAMSELCARNLIEALNGRPMINQVK